MSVGTFKETFPEFQGYRIGRAVSGFADWFHEADRNFESWILPKVNRLMTTRTMAELENSFMVGMQQPLVPDWLNTN